MARPYGTKNNMRTPEEKEEIVLEYLNGNVGYRYDIVLCKKQLLLMNILF